MGSYFNPGNEKFFEACNSEIYVDKTALICYTNSVLRTNNKYLCVSRPRRFGKSITANMLVAYYSKGCDSKELFLPYQISNVDSFEKYCNQYNVIFLNMQEFFSRTHSIESMLNLLRGRVLREILRAYPTVDYYDTTDFIGSIQDIYEETKEPFLVIIDEWDCIFREFKENQEAQKQYLDFLRDFLKDKAYLHLVYMTGILPIKKYGTHSALNMFDEYSMTSPKQLAEYVGFTQKEVQILCKQYKMNFEEGKRWYDGYRFNKGVHIYNPRSVVSAMLSKIYDNYWNQTETFEALQNYIVMNYNGLKDRIIELLSGNQKQINTGTFRNDMTNFSSADDILTLLVHLGYLGYNFEKKEVFIPNLEVETEFINAIQNAGWDFVIQAIAASERLLQATWNREEEIVAKGIEKAHFETSILTYNDENALSCTISLAYYSARRYYIAIRELPTGKGFADIVFLPRQKCMDKPALLIELKWDKNAEGAISQIKAKQYVHALENYKENLLLIGINYEKETKHHSCIIEKYKE